MNKKLIIIVGISLSIVGLLYAFRDFNPGEIIEAISGVNLWLLALSILLMIYSVFVRAQRWRYLLLPFAPFKVSELFGATMIGYFGNAVLPFRMGELLRGYSVGKNSEVSQSAILGTIILDRILDLAGLIVVILIFMLSYPAEGWFKGILYGVVGFTIVLIIFIIWLGKTKLPWTAWEKRFRILQTPAGSKIWKIFQNLVDGVTAIRNTHHMLEITAFTIGLWVLYYVYMYLVVLSMGVDLTWVAVGILLISTTLSISVPSAPGYIGTYHAVAVAVLTEMFAIGVNEAQAFAVLMHAIGYFPLIIFGAYYFIHNSIHLADVKKV